MKSSVRLLLFLFFTTSFFSICFAEDFWMRTNFHESASRVVCTADNELYIYSSGDNWGIHFTNDNGNTWDTIPSPRRRLLGIDNTGNYLFSRVESNTIYICHKNSNNWTLMAEAAEGESADRRYVTQIGNDFIATGWGSALRFRNNWTEIDTLLSAVNGHWTNEPVVDSLGNLYLGTKNFFGESGIFRSVDNGSTWEKYPEDMFVFSLKVDSEGRIFALCEGWDGDKILRSTDNGITWELMQYVNCWPSTLLINREDEIFVGFSADWGAYGVITSNDHGNTWSDISSGLSVNDIMDMGITDDGYIYIAMFDNGIYRSVHSTTGIGEGTEIPYSCKLYQNYPNPFNGQTTIAYSLDKMSNVKISVFNSNGQKTSELVNDKMSKGDYSVTFDANGITSGIYYYVIEVNGILRETKKMLYLR